MGTCKSSSPTLVQGQVWRSPSRDAQVPAKFASFWDASWDAFGPTATENLASRALNPSGGRETWLQGLVSKYHRAPAGLAQTGRTGQVGTQLIPC